MAQTKNRSMDSAVSIPYNVLRWRVGKYFRLSKEDLNKGKNDKDDSNSVVFV